MVPEVISSHEASKLREVLFTTASPRTRTTLKQPIIQSLATTLLHQYSMLEGLVPVISSYIPKSQSDNWFVAQHRDEVLPIQAFHAGLGWSHPSVKEGIPHAKAPKAILQQCIALRLQLSDTKEGALQIKPGSHLDLDSAAASVSVPVPLYGGLFMCPLLVHSSPKIKTPNSCREVLHILYGPESLPEPFKWYSFAA